MHHIEILCLCNNILIMLGTMASHSGSSAEIVLDGCYCYCITLTLTISVTLTLTVTLAVIVAAKKEFDSQQRQVYIYASHLYKSGGNKCILQVATCGGCTFYVSADGLLTRSNDCANTCTILNLVGKGIVQLDPAVFSGMILTSL